MRVSQSCSLSASMADADAEEETESTATAKAGRRIQSSLAASAASCSPRSTVASCCCILHLLKTASLSPPNELARLAGPAANLFADHTLDAASVSLRLGPSYSTMSSSLTVMHAGGLPSEEEEEEAEESEGSVAK